ncbi:hypothetical protein LVB87_09405 [Lysobacter sp. KIS68-7]|uniref:hypothetical protein n=1 Tax=Lysobacter sp. KIS68-7 TaxID=2904252 RepID=UPI001E3675B7|nr:hypothetical protein [Lysobacter sp. KIS68-7]UHQ18430.1 hypothetical protein LVB87_09405 [Lysobacter sp. KIS68-7]
MIRIVVSLLFGCLASIAYASDDTVRWPVPWTLGSETAYEGSLVTEQENGVAKSSYRVTTTEVHRIVGASNSGFEMLVENQGSRIEMIEGDPARANALQPMFKLSDASPTRVELDATGRMVGLHVDPELSVQLKKAGKPGLESVMRSQIDALPEDQRAPWRAQMDALVEKILDQNLSVAAMEATRREWWDLTALVGRSYKPGEVQEVPSAFFNSECGVMPAPLYFWLDPTRTDAHLATIQYRRAAKADAGEKGCRAPDFEQVEEGDIVFDRATGLVESTELRITTTQGVAMTTVNGRTKRKQ